MSSSNGDRRDALGDCIALYRQVVSARDASVAEAAFQRLAYLLPRLTAQDRAIYYERAATVRRELLPNIDKPLDDEDEP